MRAGSRFSTKRKLLSGHTLVDVMTSATLNAVAIAGAAAILLGGSSSWIRGQAKTDAETSAETGIRIIAQELRGAMSATVDANGQGITYQLPAVDSAGRYKVPMVSDNISRRIAYSNGNLVKTIGGSSRNIVKGVILTDPQSTGGTGTYKIFTPGVGSVVRSISMMLVTKRNGVRSDTVSARNRETIYIRNVPQITR